MSFQINNYNVIVLTLISSGCINNIDRDRYIDIKSASEIIDPIEYQDTGSVTQQDQIEETNNQNQDHRQGTSHEESDVQIPDQWEVLVNITEIPAGEKCSNGGKLIEVGFDNNENGVLEQHEITNFEYICNDENQSNTSNQSDNNTIIVSTQQVVAGEDCQYGGYVIFYLTMAQEE